MPLLLLISVPGLSILDIKGGISLKSRVVAGILGILLGSLGIHKFYLGKVGMGILYLIFSWTGIPGIIGLIEGILYLVKSDEEFQAKYVNK